VAWYSGDLFAASAGAATLVVQDHFPLLFLNMPGYVVINNKLKTILTNFTNVKHFPTHLFAKTAGKTHL
jgi:hypothetical protein